MPTTCGSGSSAIAAWRWSTRRCTCRRRRGPPNRDIGHGPCTPWPSRWPCRSRTTRAGSTRPRRTSRPCSRVPSRGSRGWATCSRARSTWSSRAWSAPCRARARRTSPSAVAQPKLRASALNHLKLAADQLPDVAEAQARYGVALVLPRSRASAASTSRTRLRQGNLEPQYQIWAAWSILQAGYPEEAEPIVESLFRQVDQGTLPARAGGDAPPDLAARSTRPGAAPGT